MIHSQLDVSQGLPQSLEVADLELAFEIGTTENGGEKLMVTIGDQQFGFRSLLKPVTTKVTTGLGLGASGKEVTRTLIATKGGLVSWIAWANVRIDAKTRVDGIFISLVTGDVYLRTISDAAYAARKGQNPNKGSGPAKEADPDLDA